MATAKNGKGDARLKHVPMRQCISCRERMPQQELHRVVRTPNGDVLPNPPPKTNGRGAYLCGSRQCWEQALRRATLERALGAGLTPDSRAELRAFIQQHQPTTPIGSGPAAE